MRTSYGVYDATRGGSAQAEVFTVNDTKGHAQTVTYRHERLFDLDQILTADPVELDAGQWDMFVDHGHGLHAVSMLTLSIAKLGLYLSEVEKLHDVYPELQEDGSSYKLSDGDLAKLDKNSQKKYKDVLAAQVELKKLYEAETKVDPNSHIEKEALRAKVLHILRSLRVAGRTTAGVSRTAETLDHIVADAQTAALNFQWPLDPDVAEGTRFLAIDPQKHQLRSKPRHTYVYDQRLEPASASGSKMFGLRGMGAAARDNHAHCVAAAKVHSDSRADFVAAVKELKPSKGLGLPPLPDPLFGEGGNVVQRFFRPGLRLVFRLVYSVFDLTFGSARAAFNVTNAARKAIQRSVASSGVGRWFMSTDTGKAIESGWHDTWLGKILDASLSNMSLERDPEMEKEAFKAADETLSSSGEAAVTPRVTGSANFRAFTQEKDITSIIEAKAKEWAGEPSTKTEDEQKKYKSLLMYRVLTQATDVQFKAMSDSYNLGDKPFLKYLQDNLAPYHSLSEVESVRVRAPALLKGEADTTKAYQEAFVEAYKNKLQNELASPGDFNSSAKIQIAMQRAEFLASIDPAVKKAKTEHDEAVSRLQKHHLIPQGAQGPTMLRASVFGNMYTVGGAVSGVIANMGHTDPVFATGGLVTGMAMGYWVGMVAAHGMSIQAANAASHMVHAMSMSHIPQAVYLGVDPLHLGAGKFAVDFSAFVNAFVTAKASYMLLSLSDSVRGQGGFTEKFLKGFTNNPIESLILAGLLYATGHTTVELMHAQKDIGSWGYFDEATASMKPLAVILEPLLVAKKSWSAVTNQTMPPEKLKELNERIATLMTNALVEGNRTSFADDRGERQQHLYSTIFASLEAGKALEAIKVDVSQHIPEINLDVLTPITTAQSAAVGPAGELLSDSWVANEVYQNLSDAEKEQPSLYMEAISHALMLRTSIPGGAERDSVDSAAAIVDAAVAHARSKIPQAQKAPEPVTSSDRAANVARGLATTILLTPFRLAHAAVGLVVGLPVRWLMKRFDASHETTRKWEKRSGVDNLAGVGEGLSRMTALFFGGILGNLGKTVADAGSSLASKLPGETTFAQEFLGNTAPIRAGESMSRTATGLLRETTTKRPDDVPWYRSSMAKVVLVEPKELMSTSGAEGQQSAAVDSRTNGAIGFLTSVVQKYDEQKTLRFFRPEFMDPPMIRRMRAMAQDASLFVGKNKGQAALIMLKNLFPAETNMLEALFERSKKPDVLKDSYLLSSLQRIFDAEMKAFGVDHKGTHAAIGSAVGGGFLEKLRGMAVGDDSDEIDSPDQSQPVLGASGGSSAVLAGGAAAVDYLVRSSLDVSALTTPANSSPNLGDAAATARQDSDRLRASAAALGSAGLLHHVRPPSAVADNVAGIQGEGGRFSNADAEQEEKDRHSPRGGTHL